MRARPSLVASILTLTGCGVSTFGTSHPGPPPAPVGPPVTVASQSAPLEAAPFVPVLSGHHLALAGDIAVVLDPEGPNEDGSQPQVHLASVSGHALLASLNLPKGSNPQAVSMASDGYAYILARGLGGVIALDVARQQLGAFSKVCDAPVDLATRDQDVLVACRGGEVVTLAFGHPPEVTRLDSGLERIAVDPMGRVFVATRDAAIIEVGVSAPVRPVSMDLLGGNRAANPSTPKRLLPMPGGGVAMMFQQSLSGELTETSTTSTITTGGGGYSGSTTTTITNNCPSPASRPSMTTSDGANFSTPQWLPGTHIVDATISPSGKLMVIADPAGAGVRFHSLADPSSGGPGGFNGSGDIGGNGLPMGCNPAQPLRPTDSDTLSVGPSIPVAKPTAVGFSGTTLVILNTSPLLELQTVPAGVNFPEGEPLPMSQHIPLREKQLTALTEGFNLFHSAPTAPEMDGSAHEESIACASCHPDGMSNGATTTIAGVTRRVMPLAGHLETAQLIHWVGKDFHGEVAEGTWHTNMGGAELTTSQENSLRAFIGQLKMPLAPKADPVQVQRGREAFSAAGCDACHAPATAYTNDQLADIGRGMHKVPSLVGLAYTAPYMSDGCAKTLEDRFSDAACGGGAQHGNVAALASPEDLQALIVFLKTL